MSREPGAEGWGKLTTRAARRLSDLESWPELATAEEWKHARRFLESLPDDPRADHLRWLADGDTPVACVQVFLHQYAIGGASVGMCLPEYPFVPPDLRGGGLFKALMADLLDWAAANGYPLAYDHGRKGLYTSMGYAPCFHHCMVLLRVADGIRLRSTLPVRVATAADVERHQEALRRPFPLGRGLQCRDERWRPNPDCVRLVGSGDVMSGFAVLGEIAIERSADGTTSAELVPPESGAVLTVFDAWAANAESGAALLRAVAEEAGASGCAWLRVNCRPEDTMARLAVLGGGELRACAAQERDYTSEGETSGGEDVDAFYLTNLPLAVEQLLPELQDRWRVGGLTDPAAISLATDDETVGLALGSETRLLHSLPTGAPEVRLPRKAMTQAIVGYAVPTELALLHDGCVIPSECRAAADALFPARRPHLIHEGLAFARAEEFGLVP